MKKQFVLPLAILTMCALPVVAQSGPGSADTLSEILVEVRALRVAVEGAASTTPQIQLLAARLTVQNERVTRATRDAQAAHEQFEHSQGEIAALESQAAELEDKLAHEAEPARQAALKLQQRALKQQGEATAAASGRLQARDAELANELAAEQTQWAELNRRFDELERALASRRPQ